MGGNWDQKVRNPLNRGHGSNSRGKGDYRNYKSRGYSRGGFSNRGFPNRGRGGNFKNLSKNFTHGRQDSSYFKKGDGEKRQSLNKQVRSKIQIRVTP